MKSSSPLSLTYNNLKFLVALCSLIHSFLGCSQPFAQTSNFPPRHLNHHFQHYSYTLHHNWVWRFGQKTLNIITKFFRVLCLVLKKTFPKFLRPIQLRRLARLKTSVCGFILWLPLITLTNFPKLHPENTILYLASLWIF
jgi:hypothetical protein